MKDSLEITCIGTITLEQCKKEPIDEIIAYWYPSHKSLLSTRGSDITKQNFENRKELIEYVIIHRVDGEQSPFLPE